MSSFFSSSSRKNILVFFILFFISFSLILLSHTKFVVAGKEFQELVFYPFRTISRGIGKILFIRDNNKKEEELKSELEKYKKALVETRQQLATIADYRKKNGELRELLDLRQSIEYHSIVADIIGLDLNFNYAYISINKGRIDGIAKNDPVIAFFDGNKVVIGLIAESSVFSSKIKTIESGDFALGVTLENSGTNGVAEGLEAKLNLMKLLYISKSTNLRVGEKVVTSAESQLFPPNILIGIVSSIDTTNKTIMSHQAYVKPLVNLAQISQVFILKPNIEKK